MAGRAPLVSVIFSHCTRITHKRLALPCLAGLRKTVTIRPRRPTLCRTIMLRRMAARTGRLPVVAVQAVICFRSSLPVRIIARNHQRRLWCGDQTTWLKKRSIFGWIVHRRRSEPLSACCLWLFPSLAAPIATIGLKPQPTFRRAFSSTHVVV